MKRPIFPPASHDWFACGGYGSNKEMHCRLQVHRLQPFFEILLSQFHLQLHLLHNYLSAGRYEMAYERYVKDRVLVFPNGPRWVMLFQNKGKVPLHGYSNDWRRGYPVIAPVIFPGQFVSMVPMVLDCRRSPKGPRDVPAS